MPFLKHFGAMMLVALLASLGMAAVGTLVSAMTHGLRQQGVVLSMLVLPLMVPVVLAAAETTRLI
ncbi:MAG: cytochrome C biogenesis protein, partial [Burkholderiales bacterium]|nr:cytochrome C biogenesis protein [Burkholderiales bacterium]